MANAILVVDMSRGFLEEGNPLYCGEESRKIIPSIERLLDQEQKKGSKIFFVADCHAPDDLEFKIFPPHCISGSPESEIIPELKRFPGKMVPKQRYSAFYNTTLEKELQKLKPDKIIVCGVCTDICVLHTVADARNRDYAVEVPSDCIASFDNEAQKWALQHMEKVLGARLTRVKELK